MGAKLLLISHALSYFHEIEFEIWACFGPAGSTDFFCNFAMFVCTAIDAFSHIFVGKTYR